MHKEIRLGNEALARHDMETAKQHFQKLLAEGGTPLQERIAANRLREIQDHLDALLKPDAAKPRTRRKTTRSKKTDTADEAPHKFVRPPEHPVVTIKKYV
jgi:hypothetical protein